MQIILIKPKKEFETNQLEILLKYDVLFYNDISDFENNYIDNEVEKILAFDADYTGWSFSNNLFDKISNLKAICLSTTAFDYIDLDYCKNKKIIVTNIPKYAGESVAEYMFFQALSLAKKLPLQIKNFNKQDYSNDFKQMNLKGKKAGIIGLGNNGMHLANLCSGFGMEVYYFNRTKKNTSYIPLSLKDIFKKCDVIFETLSINKETEKLITDEMINCMDNKTIFVSGTGKKLFNSDLVLEKVKNNTLYGCGWEEADKELNFYKGNVFVTNEYAWFTKEAIENRIDIWIKCIESIIGDKPINIVNE